MLYQCVGRQVARLSSPHLDKELVRGLGQSLEAWAE